MLSFDLSLSSLGCIRSRRYRVLHELDADVADVADDADDADDAGDAGDADVGVVV